VALAGSFSSFWELAHREFWYGQEINRRRMPIAEWLREHTPPGALVALNPAGVIPYFSKLRTLDQLGLTDAHIAREGKHFTNDFLYGHNRYDSEYVLSRRPDVLILGPATVESVHPALVRRVGPITFETIATTVASNFYLFPGDEETWKNPTFRRLYTPMIVSLDRQFFYFFNLDRKAVSLQEKIDSGTANAEERVEMDRILASKGEGLPEPGPPPQAGSPSPVVSDLREVMERMEAAVVRGDESAAEQVLLSGLQHAPEDPLLLFNLGVLYERSSRLDEAKAAYQRAVTARPEYVDAWINLGTVCARRNDLKGAREAWERALSLDPASPARENLRLLTSQEH
jgi:hypothetical protein